MSTDPATGGDVEVDPFDLPDWLGTADVTWSTESRLGAQARLRGSLVAEHNEIGCDVVAADEAYPAPVVAESVRADVHRSWTHGEVHLVQRAGRLTLLVPATRLSTDDVLEALRRLAKAVGAPPGNFRVSVRL